MAVLMFPWNPVPLRWLPQLSSPEGTPRVKRDVGVRLRLSRRRIGYDGTITALARDFKA